jgi:hypothetical protein
MSEYKKNIKLSDYLNKILEANSKIAQHNAFITRYRPSEKIEPLLHEPSESELVKKFGGKFENIRIIAKIGSLGKRIHKITIHALNTKNGYIIWNAISDCGSQKWTREGRSPIMPFESADLSLVNCDKCLGIRVKGGKDQNFTQYKCRNCGHTGRLGEFIDTKHNWVVRHYECPKCKDQHSPIKVEGTGTPSKRIPIDPMSRPRSFMFIFKKDFNDTLPHNIGRTDIERDYAKGMKKQKTK